jgi:hypothetical protein
MKMRVVRRGERRGAEGITSCGHSPLTPPVLNLLDRVRVANFKIGHRVFN